VHLLHLYRRSVDDDDAPLYNLERSLRTPSIKNCQQCYYELSDSLSKRDWKSVQVVNSHLVSDPTIRQPGFDIPRQQWSLLDHFRTEQGHCGACRRKWRLTDTDLCPCGKTQTILSHIVESCPLTKLNAGLSWLVVSAKPILRMKMLFCGWPVMVDDTHTRRRRSKIDDRETTTNGIDRGALSWQLLHTCSCLSCSPPVMHKLTHLTYSTAILWPRCLKLSFLFCGL